MDDVRQDYATVSSTTQGKLRPYLLSPSSGESWYAQKVMSGQGIRAAVDPLTRQTITTTNGKVKIWYYPELAGQAGRAQRIAAEIDRHMWGKLTELFGRDLPQACGAGCAEGGGDERLDVYMIDRIIGQGHTAAVIRARVGSSSDVELALAALPGTGKLLDRYVSCCITL
jgi:hypothetical protein